MGILKKRGSVLALMRSKIKFSLSLSLILCLMMVSLASADLGTPVNSRWAYTIPTIDGTISPGEWTDATVRDFTLNMRRRSDGLSMQNLSARFYVKNNLTHIDAAVQIFDEDFDAQNEIALGYDSFALLFEDDHDHTLENGDNGVGFHLYPPNYENFDWYYDGTMWRTDKSAGQNNNGAFNWSHTNTTEEAIGNYTFEMTIPLVGPDGDAYDLAITTLPRTVGFKIWFYERDEGMDGVYPDDPTINNNALETIDATTYGNLILHPRYTLTITTTAGGTTNPAPGVYTYGWGEVASVLAIPSSGYIFHHWELDGFNVGASNPKSVTMDSNHTLHAVFISAPPPAVGGTAAPIVAPINKPTSLNPLIWLASTMIIPIAVTLVFMRLKKKKR